MASLNPGVRVRFAPSPTGALHLGGARTALFNYLFARHNNGRFIVRIEDTDRARSTKESELEIFEMMEWMGMRSDEPVERQTERMGRYEAVASQLLAAGAAYRCYCTAEAIERDRAAAEAEGKGYRYPGTCRELSSPPPGAGPFVLRLKVPQARAIEIDDLVRGKVVVRSEEVDDWILVRSEGTPTYNFTVVVDDTDMRITHVIRGEDHLANTPKQILLYQAMGKPAPAFAHVSMILGSDKTKLSKRHGATSVRQFREQGILAPALLNYLARLGWSHGDQEVFTLDEMIRLFELEEVNPAAAVFNPEKLLWVNAQHLKALADGDLCAQALDYARFTKRPEAGLMADADCASRAMGSLKTRARTLAELLDQVRPFLTERVEFESGLLEAVSAPEKSALLGEVSNWLAARTDFEATRLEQDFRSWCEQKSLKLGEVAQPLRIALTGRKASPPIFQVIEVLGKRRTIDRIAAVCGAASR
ncbi:MAG: glutamate--tRNA ligase [Candidatus Wallbacteria bacterium]|nr:glutamate--tRNA ligase [Candidatus Wallbacteria bacterium]